VLAPDDWSQSLTGNSSKRAVLETLAVVGSKTAAVVVANAFESLPSRLITCVSGGDSLGLTTQKNLTRSKLI